MNFRIKKISSLFIALIMVFAQMIPVYANEEENGPRLSCRVTLTSENGTKYLVNAYEVPQTRTISEDGNISATFEYSLDEDNMVLLTRAQSNDEWDKSGGVNGYITIDFSRRYRKDGSPEYLLENVFGGWTIDDSSIKLSDRFLAYTCQDVTDLYQTAWHDDEDFEGNTFEFKTGFTKYAYKYSRGVLGACSTVKLKRGTRSEWDLIVECNYFNNSIYEVFEDILFSSTTH